MGAGWLEERKKEHDVAELIWERRVYQAHVLALAFIALGEGHLREIPVWGGPTYRDVLRWMGFPGQTKGQRERAEENGNLLIAIFDSVKYAVKGGRINVA